MTSYTQWAALPTHGRQVVVRDAGLGGSMVKSCAAAWRPWVSNPPGRACLPTELRHHSVVYRHTLLRSSLLREQTDPGATHCAYEDMP